jgi:hypothetical protein
MHSCPGLTARRKASLSVLLLTTVLAGCGGDGNIEPGREFLDGTADDPQIGLVVNSTGKALTLFQVGDPTNVHTIPLGASSAITPTGMALSGTHAAVPLGNAASIALVELRGEVIERIFTFPSGNASGAAFADATTLLATNTTDGYVGRATLDQASTAITHTVAVAPAPTAVVMAASRAFVISGNLDENFAPLGNGVVTAVDPATLTVLGIMEAGGTNSAAGALAPNGKLYVVNTADFVSDASVTIIDPITLQPVKTLTGFGPGAGSIHIDAAGLAYLSSFGGGTVIWNTASEAFVRGPDDPVCARLEIIPGAPCRGAFDAATTSDGSVYQVFFGSASESLPPYVFVYSPGSYQLTDSVAVGVGPASIEIRTF